MKFLSGSDLESEKPTSTSDYTVSLHIQVPTTHYSQCCYTVDYFVAVRPEEPDDPLDFWIGFIVDVQTNQASIVTDISVHWYELYSCSDLYTGKYRELNLNSFRHSDTVRWVAKISVGSVLVTFWRLASSKRLPQAVARHMKDTRSWLIRSQFYISYKTSLAGFLELIKMKNQFSFI